MKKVKNGFGSMALVYTFLVIFLFLMLAILRTYIEKDKFLEAINYQIDDDISKDKQNRSYFLSKLLEDNTPQAYDSVKLVKPASDDLGNGNGLYYINDKTLTDENNDGKSNRIYFFRGSVENNHIIYANMCFRIVRTNEDGSLRIIYDGPVASNKCKDAAHKPNVSIGEVSFSNNETNSLVDIDNGRIPSYDEVNTHSNIIDTLNTWYIANIIETNYTEDVSKNTIFCNNKKDYLFTTNKTYYEARGIMPVYKDNSNRNKYNPDSLINRFSLTCTNQTDRFVVTDRSLSYPVGVLSADEVLLAGGYLTDTDDEYQSGPGGLSTIDFYLKTNKTFWTSSAYSRTTSNQNYVVAVDTDGVMRGKHVTETASVIPVISLNGNMRITTGNGTASNPYRVD